MLDKAKTHMDREEFPQAIHELHAHLNTDFHDETAIFLLAACHLRMKNFGLSAVMNRQAIEVRKNKSSAPFPEAVGNLAACFKEEQKPDAAAELWDLAISMETDPAQLAQYHMNIGGCYTNRGEPEKALEYYTKALELRPDLLGAQYNRAYALLELGRWKEGWESFHVGLTTGHRKNRRYGKGDIGELPQWDGEPGQTVVVWGEQGIGDEILYASCIPDLIECSEHVIFDCHPRMEALFRRSFPKATIHGTRKTMSEIPWLEEVNPDAAVCISTLPMHFRNADKDFPGKPFLKTEPDILPSNGKPRIGISWRGGTKQTHTDLRTIPLDQWLPVLNSIDADFYSLQYTPDAAGEVCELEENHGFHVKHWPGKVQCKDYDVTAGFVAGLDLVITVCTAIHHLSNAVGNETWTLVPSRPAWRYASKGELWYSETSRFFRQEDGEPWSGAIERVAAALRVRYQARDAAE